MSEQTIMGLDSALYTKLAEAHSKAKMFMWLIGGALYMYFDSTSQSLVTIFLFLIPGCYVVSFASMFSFWVEVQKSKIMGKSNRKNVIFIFTMWILWFCFDFVYPVLLSILYINVVDGIVSSIL